MQTFSEHCNSGIYNLKFHLLDHVLEELKALGTLSVLDASSFAQYNVHVMHAYMQTLRIMDAWINKTARMVGGSGWLGD